MTQWQRAYTRIVPGGNNTKAPRSRRLDNIKGFKGNAPNLTSMPGSKHSLSNPPRSTCSFPAARDIRNGGDFRFLQQEWARSGLRLAFSISYISCSILDEKAGCALSLCNRHPQDPQDPHSELASDRKPLETQRSFPSPPSDAAFLKILQGSAPPTALALLSSPSPRL